MGKRPHTRKGAGEARCTSEIMQLLDRAAEEEGAGSAIKADGAATPSRPPAFADSIAAEVAQLKCRDSKKFKTVPVGGLSCIVFIETSCDPLPIVQRLFARKDGHALYAARFCQRIVPLSVICSANLEDVRREALLLIKEAFSGTQKYCVIFESRFSHALNRTTTIDVLADLVGSRHKVDLEHPDLVIMVQVFMNVCGLSVLPSYGEFKRYNIQEHYKEHLPQN